MGRKITMQANLDIAGPEVIFNILFGDGEFMKRYHKKFNSDPHAECSTWSNEQCREVKYVAIVEAPKVIAKIIDESFPVIEVQRFRKDGDCYIVKSNPTMDSPSEDRFVTEAETSFAPASGGGCAITSIVMVEYQSNWFKGTVESFMEAKARIGFQQWLALAKCFCKEKLAVTGAQETDDVEDCFFDAEDASVDDDFSIVADNMSPINRIISRVKATFSSSTDNDISVVDPHSMQGSVDVREPLAAKVLKVEDDLSYAVQAWKRKQVALDRGLKQTNAKLVKLEEELAAAKLSWEQQDMALKTRIAGLVGTGFATGMTAGIILGYFYLRAKKQNMN